MTHDEKSFSEGVGVTAHLSAHFQEATNLRILDALVDVLTDGERADIRTRFAVAILLTAVFIESTASFLLEQLRPGQDIEEVEKSLGISWQDYPPEPLRKLLASYSVACRTACPHSMDGLHDIFRVRNKIVAHPAGTAKENLDLRDDGSWDRKRADRALTYTKFTEWLATLSQFKREHAHEAIAETKAVLRTLRGDLERAGVDDSILKRMYPPSLDNWMVPE